MAVTRTLPPLLLLLPAVISDQRFSGSCPNIPPVSNFDHQRFVSGRRIGISGHWFTYGGRGFPLDRRCKSESQYAISDGRIKSFGQYVQTSDNKTVPTSGMLTPLQEGVARFNVTTSDPPSPLLFDLIATNYQYSIFFHCANQKDGKEVTNTQILLIFTRLRNPQSITLYSVSHRKIFTFQTKIIQTIEKKLQHFNSEFGLDASFHKIDQNDCPKPTAPRVRRTKGGLLELTPAKP